MQAQMQANDADLLMCSLESMVADHSALSERLINAALPVRTESVEVDIFEQAFGPDSSPPHGQALKPLLPAPQPVTPRTASRDLAMSDEMAKRRGQAEIQVSRESRAVIGQGSDLVTGIVQMVPCRYAAYPGHLLAQSGAKQSCHPTLYASC